LNTEFFIAKRIISRTKGNFSRPVIRIAIIAIALGFTVMFVSVAILTGFQREIREKVIGFGGHIQIARFTENATLEPQPVEIHQAFLKTLRDEPGIRHIQVYGIKAGIIKTQDDIQGVVFKGVGKDFDWSFFKKRIVEGKPFTVTDTGRTSNILISGKLSRLLNLKLHDDLRMYFISGNNTLGRKFNICGIYETGLEEFDNMYLIGDIHQIQRLNNWTGDQAGGFEILINDFKDIDRLGKFVYKQTGFSLDASTIKQRYPQIFDWLDLQDINVLIILILMILVSAITMISTLLILILERTNMIGILKSLGMTSAGIRRIFLFNAVYIIGIGLLAGNMLGFGFCILQKQYGLITLPQESYYVSVVPIFMGFWNIILLNASTILVCYLMLVIPSFIVTRISPVKAIRFS